MHILTAMVGAGVLAMPNSGQCRRRREGAAQPGPASWRMRGHRSCFRPSTLPPPPPPAAVAQMGWVGGIVCLLFFSFVQLTFSQLLASVFEVRGGGAGSCSELSGAGSERSTGGTSGAGSAVQRALHNSALRRCPHPPAGGRQAAPALL